jgi:putative hydrolase of the HAD superfamily
VCSALDVDLNEADFFDGWNRVFVGEMPDIYDLLEQATRNRYPLFLFSNTNAAHETYIRRRFQGVLRHFKGEFLSHRMGFLKPEAEIFQVVIDEIGPADKILFFDDTLDNVEAAQLSGMHAVHVTTETTVQDTLRMT